jgi:glycosyltransferase involved in cell wall biosynthesis
MTVSVIVPVYNRGPQIAPTLDSVLQQTLSPLEVIVVDDGSVDESATWIEAHYGARVQVIRQPNGGVARARNRGLQQARGEFIAFLDHDDIWHPNKLERQIQALHSAPDAALCWCLWREIEADGTEREAGKRLWEQPFWRGRSGWVFDDFTPKNILLSASVPLIRTHALREIGGFDPRTQPSDDWDCWLRLARRHSFVFLPETLLDYSWHATNQSHDERAMWHGSQRALIKHWPAFWKRPRVLWLVLGYAYFLKTFDFYQQARAAIARGDWREVRRQMVRSALRFPGSLFTAQWVYVLLRFLKRDARPF